MATKVRSWKALRPRVTQELLDDIVRRIVDNFHPERIVLFGSYAYGKRNPDSDLDLLIVMESDEPVFSRIRRVADVAEEPYLPMDVIVRTPLEIKERLAMGDPFVSEIFSKGKTLYERPE